MKYLEWKQVKELTALLLSDPDTQSVDDLAGEISSIRYCVDILAYGNTRQEDRHIDIEFVFGAYHELRKEEKPYQFIESICQLQRLDPSGELELILYEK